MEKFDLANKNPQTNRDNIAPAQILSASIVTWGKDEFKCVLQEDQNAHKLISISWERRKIQEEFEVAKLWVDFECWEKSTRKLWGRVQMQHVEEVYFSPWSSNPQGANCLQNWISSIQFGLCNYPGMTLEVPCVVGLQGRVEGLALGWWVTVTALDRGKMFTVKLCRCSTRTLKKVCP